MTKTTVNLTNINLLNKEQYDAIENPTPNELWAVESHCIVETYQNGTSWYRVYSDGWCEQGGRFNNNNSSSYTVSLLKAYKDTNYTPMICTYGTNGSTQYRTYQVQTINSGSMVIWNGTDANNNYCLWTTSGYIS